jgi:hypothetical protein
MTGSTSGQSSIWRRPPPRPTRAPRPTRPYSPCDKRRERESYTKHARTHTQTYTNTNNTWPCQVSLSHPVQYVSPWLSRPRSPTLSPTLTHSPSELGLARSPCAAWRTIRPQLGQSTWRRTTIRRRALACTRCSRPAGSGVSWTRARAARTRRGEKYTRACDGRRGYLLLRGHLDHLDLLCPRARPAPDPIPFWRQARARARETPCSARGGRGLTMPVPGYGGGPPPCGEPCCWCGGIPGGGAPPCPPVPPVPPGPTGPPSPPCRCIHAGIVMPRPRPPGVGPPDCIAHRCYRGPVVALCAQGWRVSSSRDTKQSVCVRSHGSWRPVLFFMDFTENAVSPLLLRARAQLGRIPNV